MVSEHSGVFNAELQAAYELSFMLELASCIVSTAMDRRESRGAHYRTDFPKRNDKFYFVTSSPNKSISLRWDLAKSPGTNCDAFLA